MSRRDLAYGLFLAALIAGALGWFVWYALTPVALTPTDFPYPPR